MALDVSFGAYAIEDLEAIDAYIAQDSPANATAFLERLRAFCARLSDFPRQGLARDDLATGVRMRVFERRIVVLYRFDAATLLILRVVYAGRNLDDLWPSQVAD